MSRQHRRGDSRGKQAVYLPSAVLDAMRVECRRLDRSLSWVAQLAWTLAREQLLAYPASPLLRRKAGGA